MTLVYICIRLALKFNNPYFRLTAVAYALELTLAAVPVARISLPFTAILTAPISFSFFFLITLFLTAYAALLYREGWEGGNTAIERFFALVPGAKRLEFWLVLGGAAFIINGSREVFFLYFARPALTGYTTGLGPILTGIAGTVLSSATLLIMLINVLLNLALFRSYRISFFIYLFFISLAILAHPILQTVFSFYADMVHTVTNPGFAVYTLAHSRIFMADTVMQAVWDWAVPAATALAFLAYDESRRGNSLSTTARP